MCHDKLTEWATYGCPRVLGTMEAQRFYHHGVHAELAFGEHHEYHPESIFKPFTRSMSAS